MTQISRYIDTSDVKVETFGPSTFTFLRNGCRYQYFLTHTKKMDKGAILPSPKATLLGTIIHELFEERTNGEIPDEETFEAKWEEKVGQMQDTIKQRYGLESFPLVDYDRMYSAMETTMGMREKSCPGSANAFHSLPASNNNDNIFAEEKCSWDIFSGKIDCIEIENGEIRIIDYKTGKILDENGDIKEEYITQLNLYAWMYESLHNGSTVSSLQVMTVDGQKYDIQRWNEDRLNAVLEDAKQLLYEMNHTENKESLALPGELCGLCSAKLVCRPYWNASRRNELDADEDSAPVTYEDKEFIVQNVINNDVVEYESGDEKGRIRGMSRFSSKLEIGKTYRFRGLRFDRESADLGRIYAAGKYSIFVEVVD